MTLLYLLAHFAVLNLLFIVEAAVSLFVGVGARGGGGGKRSGWPFILFVMLT